MPAKKPTKPPLTFVASLKRLKSPVEHYAAGSIEETGFHGLVLRASVAKAFELAVQSHGPSAKKDPFFVTASLRGVCEDLIAFSFLENVPPTVRDRMVELHMATQVYEGLVAQVEFFKTTRPWQAVVSPAARRNKKGEEAELRQITKGLGWNGRTAWPSVWHMAKAAGLDALYRYVYSATSKWVHFSPHVLMRMGWGPLPLSKSSVWRFSTKHFTRYYLEFNKVYSVYLLLQLLNHAAEFPKTVQARRAITSLSSALDALLRWPELVTFEELNRKPPHEFFQLLARVAYEAEPSTGEPT